MSKKVISHIKIRFILVQEFVRTTGYSLQKHTITKKIPFEMCNLDEYILTKFHVVTTSEQH